MVFYYDKEINKNVAIIINGDIVDRYNFILHSCGNPFCTCGVVHIQLFPLGQKEREDLKFPHTVSIDILQKKSRIRIRSTKKF